MHSSGLPWRSRSKSLWRAPQWALIHCYPHDRYGSRVWHWHSFLFYRWSVYHEPRAFWQASHKERQAGHLIPDIEERNA